MNVALIRRLIGSWKRDVAQCQEGRGTMVQWVSHYLLDVGFAEKNHVFLNAGTSLFRCRALGQCTSLHSGVNGYMF